MARPADPNARQKLLRAAETLFASVGVERAHVEAIAAEAGVSKGAFYNHFASKDDAFRELVEGLLHGLRARIEGREAPASTETPHQFFARCLEHDVRIFEFIWENRLFMRVVLEGGRSHAFVHLLDEFAEQTRLEMRELLERGRAVGLYREDLDVELTSIFFAGGYDRLARAIVRANERPDFRHLLSTIQRTVVFGISRHASPSPSGDAP